MTDATPEQAITPFEIALERGHHAQGIVVLRKDELGGAVEAVGLQRGCKVLVVVGGAGGLDEAGIDRLRPLFDDGLAPLVQASNVSVVDGGTDSGVMKLTGQARARSGGSFPLVGVTAVGAVALPNRLELDSDAAQFEPHHTHFILVPGDQWGDESPWISEVATAMANGAPSVTVLINGGEIAWEDVWQSVRDGRPVVVVAGTGRTADRVARAVREGTHDQREERLAASGLLKTVDLDAGPEALVRVLEDLLKAPEDVRSEQQV